MATKRVDPNISALKGAGKALNKCTSRRALVATLEFLWDFYIGHPSKGLPKRLKP